MADQRKWVDKVLEQFAEELHTPPEDPDEVKLQQKIIMIVQFRANGLDYRRMGLLAADFYRLMHATRHRIIDDLARVAIKNEKGGEVDALQTKA